MSKRYKAEKKYLDCCGRYIYNSQDDGTSFENIFRGTVTAKFAAVNRNINIKCASIKGLIKQQKIVDESLKLELETQKELSDLHEKKYSSAYSVSFQFKSFSTNSENHLLNTRPNDDHGYRLSKIGTLGSYESIQYTCWDAIDNEKLIKILNNKRVKVDEEEALALSQIVSLFVCESSRNPSAFLTAPMSLELAENEFNNKTTELEQKVKSLRDKTKTKSVKAQLKQYTDELEELKSNKSEIIKNFILEYFPMAIEKAVSASRHNSNEINEMDIKEFTHKYDNGRAGVSHARKLESKTLKIIEKWDSEEGNTIKKHFFDDMNDMASKWYGIDTTELVGTEYDWN